MMCPHTDMWFQCSVATSVGDTVTCGWCHMDGKIIGKAAGALASSSLSFVPGQRVRAATDARGLDKASATLAPRLPLQVPPKGNGVFGPDDHWPEVHSASEPACVLGIK
eukprot:gene9163-biopygen8875